jgi:tetratricopeptide (TPR) repeat protein
MPFKGDINMFARFHVIGLAVSCFFASPAIAATSPFLVDLDRPVPADELHQRALDLLSSPGKWRQAARLLEQSANLRDPADRERFTSLLFAGRVYHVAGQPVKALDVIEQAGDQALATGSIIDAAHAYIQAGAIAVELKRNRDAQRLAQKAGLLAKSPLLNETQRGLILNRLAS